MKRLFVTVPVALLALWALAGATLADEGGGSLRTSLSGFQEVPPRLTNGHGTLTLQLGARQISYVLTYSGLSSPATAAHLHFGQKGVNGDIFAFLCGGPKPPACPPSGTVSGTIEAADIIGIPAQGVPAGDLGAALRIIRSGTAYANVHTGTFPGGEIRGQVPGTGRDD
jgi:CHRD domain